MPLSWNEVLLNIEAVEILGHLHDALEGGGYKGHDLERFLVRVLFCLFAEDTSLFEREGFLGHAHGLGQGGRRAAEV